MKHQLSFFQSKNYRNAHPDSNSSTLVVGMIQEETKPQIFTALRKDADLAPVFEALKNIPTFSGAFESTQILYNAQSHLKQLSPGISHILGVGVGSAKDCHAQKILSLGGRIARDLKNGKLNHADVLIDTLYQAASSAKGDNAPKDFAGRKHRAGVPNREEFFEYLATGILLGLYTFETYKSQKKPDKATPKDKAPASIHIRLLSGHLDNKTAQAILNKVNAVCESAYLVRDLQTTPGADLTPPELARQAQLAGKDAGFNVTVWDEKKLKAEGMGGILAVGQGSDNPPRFVICEYNLNKKNLPTLVFVGKGITFDTGGYCLKPGNAMIMHWDMSGAAAVLGAIHCLAKLKAPVRVVTLICSAENMINGHALRVGDIYRAYDGQTVEVLNTDAEGRLVLGDGLAYAKKYAPDCVFDVATLTGAVGIALGSQASGMMGNNGKLLEGFTLASEKVGERVWELPLYEEYGDDMKSKVADIKNIGSNRDAGSQKGGAFLNFFVKGAYPWVHLDIASTADTPSGQGAHCPPDVGTAVPMRALVEFALNFKKYF
jgi:leucyl aminopeptidase